MARSLTFWPALGLLFFLACGSDEGDSTSQQTTPSCTPGQTLACACPGTAITGAQTCQSDGKFGACTGCPGGDGGASSAGSGGASGTGPGTSGSSGQGGTSAGQGGTGTAGTGTAGTGTAGTGTAGTGTAGTSQGGAGQAGASGSPQGGGGSSGSSAQGGAGSGGGQGWPASCEDAVAQGTTVGCEFWAVDLDNEPDSGQGANAAAEPWGLVLANSGAKAADVTIEYNDGAPGQAQALKQHKKVTIAAGSYFAEAMPSREVDGGKSPGDPDAPGTFLSSAAFRITSTLPITAHQFNTATNSFSNDASMLLPTHALGTSHRVLGWQPANPVPIPGVSIPGIPDRAYITIVGTAAGTTVKITPAWSIKAGGAIPVIAAGSTFEAKLGPFDVLNLETADSTSNDGAKGGELSGSLVESDKPVAVFFGSERGPTPAVEGLPKPPGWSGDTCCTDHLEEQIPPVTALGTRYAIARSPVRSVGWVEPDVLRVVAADKAVTVKTSLAGAFAQFDLQPGEKKDLWTTTDMTLEASGPVLVGQLLVSQDLLSGVEKGDPALVILPAIDQFLTEQAVPVPLSWTEQYLAVVHPVGADLLFNGTTPTNCESHAIGQIDGTSYEALRCPVTSDLWRVKSGQPFGVTAYGYGSAGSYAVTGVSRMKK